MLSSRIICLGLIVSSVAAFKLENSEPGLEQVQTEFAKFMKDFGKRYSTPEEFQKRMSVFAENLRKIKQHNAEKHSWKMGVNKFADLTEDEFRTLYTGGYVKTASPTSQEGSSSSNSGRRGVWNATKLPSHVDWRERGVVSEAKDQQSCGSCWALAAVEQLESYLALATGNEIRPLSIQQLVSCVPNTMHCGGSGGCQGAIPQLAYLYTQLYGLTLEADYPYTSGLSQIAEECQFDAKTMKAAVYIHGYETLHHNNMEAVLNHLANVGPLAASVDATAFNKYESGVFDACSYTENINMNHAVQLVGYGTDVKEGDYWLVRNSWGPGWGENGYIRLKRDTSTKCGLDVTPSKGTQCTGDGNDVQKVCGMCGILFDNSYPLGVDVVSGIKPF